MALKKCSTPSLLEGFLIPLTPALSLREREKTHTDLYIVLDRFPHLREGRKPAPTFTSCSIGSLTLVRGENPHRPLHHARSVPSPQGEGENPHRPLHRARSVPSPKGGEKTRTDLYIMLDRPPHLREREKTCTDLYIVLDRSLTSGKGENPHRPLHHARSVPSPSGRGLG
ncbi:hypothetical protein DFQ50_104285 [Pseudocitrobacter faecalis]|uniref:Uncharacterized protein n=1 Tax=Pseudocitrobacter faecalis TaxID=1398493 RepID=A0ABX9FXC4_9ENTR|nr:hypothetical protein DFQ50_104285 [Pseudocitrobacter faecalis]